MIYRCEQVAGVGDIPVFIIVDEAPYVNIFRVLPYTLKWSSNFAMVILIG